MAAAAGDVAGGAHPRGYSWVTQTSTVVAYHLLEHDAVKPDILAGELALLDHTESGIRCYRGESASFRSWLDAERGGSRLVDRSPSSEPASRVAPVGVWFRRSPDRLVEAATAVASLTHGHPPSVVLAVAVAGAVAGACFAQSGRDLVYGAVETGRVALSRLDRGEAAEAAAELRRLEKLAPLVLESPTRIVTVAGGDEGPRGTDGAVVGILLGASALVDPVKLIEAGAMSGGSEVGAIVGAVVGARVGLRRWPWPIPNDTWFVEIGRRLVSHNREIRDLPIPFAVEERTTLELRTGPSSEDL